MLSLDSADKTDSFILDGAVSAQTKSMELKAIDDAAEETEEETDEFEEKDENRRSDHHRNSSLEFVELDVFETPTAEMGRSTKSRQRRSRRSEIALYGTLVAAAVVVLYLTKFYWQTHGGSDAKGDAAKGRK